MKKFTQFFEDMSSASALGQNSDNQLSLNNADWFAPGDSRIPKGSKTYTRNGLLKKKRKYKK